MAAAKHLYLCLLALVLPLSAVAKPAGGVAQFTDLYLPAASPTQTYGTSEVGVCKEIGLYNGSTIGVTGFYTAKGVDGVGAKVSVPFRVIVRVFQALCANTIGDTFTEKDCSISQNVAGGVLLVAESTSPLMHANSTTKHPLILNDEHTIYISSAKESTATEPPGQAVNVTVKPPANASNTTETPSAANARKRRATESTEKSPTIKPQSHQVAEIKEGSGMYIVQVLIQRDLSLQKAKENGSLTVNVTLRMRNPHGYLSAVDYPALVFYGVMTGMYTIYAFAWIVMMACAYKDLVRLQFWVLAVILLGFLEKMLFVSEYGSVNLGNDSSSIIMIAELVSAVKRALSRMLLIIVAMGFGTVKPRLGDSLGKVVAIGVVYTILAVLDGIIRARNETFVSRDAASTVTLALLLIFDSFVMYWIFTAIVDTRRTLRLRKNYVKLAMYNHFAYTLIFAIVASLGFIIWALVTLNFPAQNCLTDWREVWLRECFWHVLFAFILVIVMIIWRPSANRNRFAYSLVNDEDDIEDEEPEQGPNKNFDTLKMRQMTKSESEVPPVTSQAEDDLRWVEENLPTTAMDKALPLILDSDEEVMTTKFEISKMD